MGNCVSSNDSQTVPTTRPKSKRESAGNHTSKEGAVQVVAISAQKQEGVDVNKKVSSTLVVKTRPAFPKDSFTYTSENIKTFENEWKSVVNSAQVSPFRDNTANSMSSEDVNALIQQWQNISESPPAEPIIMRGNKQWKEIRLFISSTFTDYFAEREILVKQVVPRLREWCEGRRLTLVDIDLRWGVPAESTTETILRACLSEIDRARTVNGNPFFLNMLGQRYGWVPSIEDVPTSVAEQYQWVNGVSVTHMEIFCGAFRELNPNALFMIRGDNYIPQVPVNFLPQFLEPKFASGVALQALKNNIRKKFSSTKQVDDYTVTVKEVDTSVAGIPKIVFDGLETFGDRVYDFFIHAIDAQYPVNNEEITLSDVLSVSHDYFMEVESEIVLGRDDIVETILKNNMSETLPIILSSERGIGKSAVVAFAAKEARSRDHKVVFFSTQAKSDVPTFTGSDAAALQLLILMEFGDDSVRNKAKDFTLADTNEPEGCEKIKAAIHAMFDKKAFNSSVNPKCPAIIFIDELDTTSTEGFEMTIPSPLPVGLSLVISKTSQPKDDDGSATGGAESPHQVREISLSPLDMTVKAKIVEQRLGSYNKRLSSAQMEALLANPGTSVLRWLSLACEEIRMFGAFETVTDFIKKMPDTVLGLLQQNLLRNTEVAKNYGDGTTALMMKDTLLFCYFEEGGLKETELMELLAMRLKAYSTTTAVKEDTTKLAYAEWSVVHLFIKSFLRMVPQSDASKLLSLASQDSYKVIESHFGLVGDAFDSAQQEYALILANYFETSTNDLRRLQSYPLQLLKLGDTERIVRFKKSDTFDSVPSSVRMRVIDYLRCKDRFQPKSYQKVQPEKYCMGCAIKVNRNRARYQSCFTCGVRVFTFQSPSTTAPKLWAMETLVYRCRRHNMDAWNVNFMLKCVACKQMPITNTAMCYHAVKCQTCSLGDNDSMFRCCQLSDQ